MSDICAGGEGRGEKRRGEHDLDSLAEWGKG